MKRPLIHHGAAQHTDVTRELFLPACEGHVSAGTPAAAFTCAVVEGDANADEPHVCFTMSVPDDFVSFISIEAIWTCGAAAPANMYWLLNALYAASGEDTFNTHSDEPAAGVTATGGTNITNCQEPANALTLTDLALGDFIGIAFLRYGSHGNDTLNDTMYLLGLLFTYVGHQ